MELKDLPSLEHVMVQLVTVASVYAGMCGLRQKEEMPEDYAAYEALFAAGRSQLSINITFHPDMQSATADLAWIIDGKRHVFLSNNARQKDAMTAH